MKRSYPANEEVEEVSCTKNVSVPVLSPNECSSIITNCKWPGQEESEKLRIMPYADFLQTDYWKAVRRDTFRKQHECALCPSVNSLHIHHRTYEHRGYEYKFPRDLTVLCGDCHAKFHGKDKAAFDEPTHAETNGRNITVSVPDDPTLVVTITIGHSQYTQSERKERQHAAGVTPGLTGF